LFASISCSRVDGLAYVDTRSVGKIFVHESEADTLNTAGVGRVIRQFPKSRSHRIEHNAGRWLL
jgi:hypothetical protein